jgi:molecular chaperone DnaK (HSP70)
MANRPPPRFVPTLTEVVHSGPVPLTGTPGLSQDLLAQRVLQRVDLLLDRRVREEIATVVLEQTSAIVPLLRERLESVVREVVAEAVADEIQARQRAGSGGV